MKSRPTKLRLVAGLFCRVPPGTATRDGHAPVSDVRLAYHRLAYVLNDDSEFRAERPITQFYCVGVR